jgi:glutaredoxin
MNETIYISRRCEYCHELLILLHQNRKILKYPIIDVDTNPYPKSITSVPCMIIKGKILPGVELFKFIEYIISQKTKKMEPESSTPELLPNSMNPGNMPSNIPEPSQMRNLNQPPNDNNEINNKKSSESDELDLPGFCINGSCDLGFSTLEGDEIPTDDYEYLDAESSTKSCQLDNNITNKGEKAKQIDDDYSRMMAERGNDVMPSSR